MPWSKCPTCGDKAGFMPVLTEPTTGEFMSLEEWYRRLRVQFGSDVDVHSELPIYCEGCALDKAGELS